MYTAKIQKKKYQNYHSFSNGFLCYWPYFLKSSNNYFYNKVQNDNQFLVLSSLIQFPRKLFEEIQYCICCEKFFLPNIIDILFQRTLDNDILMKLLHELTCLYFLARKRSRNQLWRPLVTYVKIFKTIVVWKLCLMTFLLLLFMV